MNDSINGKTAVLGLIGNPIGHSFSPQLHNRLNEVLGINMVYIPFRVEEQNLEEAVKGLRALNVYGFNVTVPHKHAVINYLDELSEDAIQMGAVNTVKNINGKLHGFNTDSYGFVKSFYKSFNEDFKGKRIVMLGAGGASRAIAVSLINLGIESLFILNRTGSQAEKLAALLEDIQSGNQTNNPNQSGSRTEIMNDVLTEENILKAAANCDIIINTTSVGMYPNIEASPVSAAAIFANKPIVCDIIANPQKTRLLKIAKQNGCRIMNGVGMLYYQGIRAYEIWTGINIPDDIIDMVGKEFFNNFG